MKATLADFKQLSTLNYNQSDHEVAEYLQQKVNKVIDWLMSIDSNDFQLLDQIKSALFELGGKEQTNYWQLNKQLIQPLQQLMADTQKGGQVSELLRKLQNTIASMQPPRKRTGLIDRIKLLFSWKPSTFQMWLDSYPHKQAVVADLVEQLQEEKKQLKRDNTLLSSDHKALRAGVQKLTDCFDYVALLEQSLKQSTAIATGSEAKQLEMIQDHLLNPMQQRVIELQQQLLIANQAAMTVELIIKQNQTLIRDINQTIMTTTSALDVAIGIAVANNNQQQLDAAGNIQLDIDKLQHAERVIEETLIQLQQANKESAAVAVGLNNIGKTSIDE